MYFTRLCLIITLIMTVVSGCTCRPPSSMELTHRGVKARESYFTSNDGTSLYYKALGEGDTVVVLHGGPGLHHGYLMKELPNLAQNYRVVFYDQRGSGKSVPAILDDEHINLDVFVEDLELLRKELGVERFTLVGHSWGGLLAMAYATRHSQHLSSLVLLSSVPSNSDGFLAFAEEYKRRTAELAERLQAIRASESFIRGEPEAVTDFYRTLFSVYLHDTKLIERLPLHFEASSTVSAIKVADLLDTSVYGQPFDFRPQLAKLTVPTLVVHGDSDPIPVWTAEQTAEVLPNAEFFPIKDCGHFPDIEKPKLLISKLDHFIRSHKM